MLKRQARGFTLLEILVALLVVALGLLGLSKMQALAISNTQIASVRSLISLQASSMAAAMQANRVYWASVIPPNSAPGTAALVPPASFSVANGTVTDSSGVLNATVSGNCKGSSTTSAACTATQMAASDLQAWAANLNALFPSATAAFACSTGANVPVTCTITINWQEKYVALNRTTATGTSSQVATQSLTLYVTP